MESLATPFDVGTPESSGGSGVEIFMESGDCDLELGGDSGRCMPMGNNDFLIAAGRSGIDD